MEPNVLYEDTQFFVLDKPAGMTVNKADTTKGERTVQDWIASKFSIFNFQFSKDEESDFYKRAGIVHRIDKETSGILVVAKTLSAFLELQRQFKERIVKKTYLALVHGKVIPEEGEIRVPVGRLPWNRKRFGVVAGGRDAVTRYRVIKNYTLNTNLYTLLALFPETGRTHQIRVHLKYFGHPIFSDSLYAGRKTARNDRKILPRVFLHATKISFIHPKTGKTISFESPLPKELQKIIQTT
ncbi:MAG: RluA family pseudouridine synthase [Candidatus Levybacteria bacterium]|nr:RluA family pseudouridine synthase [Candidatus Levybacteria bacterium]